MKKLYNEYIKQLYTDIFAGLVNVLLNVQVNVQVTKLNITTQCNMEHHLGSKLLNISYPEDTTIDEVLNDFETNLYKLLEANSISVNIRDMEIHISRNHIQIDFRYLVV